MAMSWRTASYFSSSPTAATLSSQKRYPAASPNQCMSGQVTRGALKSPLSDRDTDRLARWRKTQGYPQRSLAFLFESFSAVPFIHSPPRALPAFRTSGGSAPAAKYINIDAFNGKTVTRETLVRYTFKSPPVNLLIRGNVWKNTAALPFGVRQPPAALFEPLR